MKKALTEFRITEKGTYSPTPWVSGLSLIWMGICLMAGDVPRLPRRWFYYVQAALVWQWLGRREYTNDDAWAAWAFTYYSFICCTVVGLFIRSLLS